MKRNYGISFEYSGKRRELKGKRITDNLKRYTKKGADEMVDLIKMAHLKNKLKRIKNPRVFRAK